MRILIAVVVVALFSVPWGAQAQGKQVGNWTVTTGSTSSEAFTVNDSGSTFGLFCFDRSCTFYLDIGIRCDENSKIPLLINTDSGANYSVGLCIHLGTGSNVRYVNSIQDKDIVDAIASGQVIGFAIAMKSGEFKVVRFSLNGAVAATGRAVNSVPPQPKSRDTGLRDNTL